MKRMDGATFDEIRSWARLFRPTCDEENEKAFRVQTTKVIPTFLFFSRMKLGIEESVSVNENEPTGK